MSRSIFGWSYPPGCSGPPDEAEGPCLICGEFPDNCICPDCPTCGEIGNPACYSNHGLRIGREQIAGFLRRRETEKQDLESDRRYWEQWEKNAAAWREDLA